MSAICENLSRPGSEQPVPIELASVMCAPFYDHLAKRGRACTALSQFGALGDGIEEVDGRTLRLLVAQRTAMDGWLPASVFFKDGQEPRRPVPERVLS